MALAARPVGAMALEEERRSKGGDLKERLLTGAGDLEAEVWAEEETVRKEEEEVLMEEGARKEEEKSWREVASEAEEAPEDFGSGAEEKKALAVEESAEEELI